MVYNNDHIAGTLIETDNGGFEFTYMESYLNDPAAAAISVHFPKTPKIYISNKLFPFFMNMIPEGSNRELQQRRFKLSDHDFFGLLTHLAGKDTIGAIQVKNAN
jgi:serine/threonine-protein kinase HipA